MQPGQMQRGVVCAVEEYGVLVQLAGGVTGMVYKTEISWDPVQNALDCGYVRGKQQ